MKRFLTATTLAALTLTPATGALAQTTVKTTVSHDTGMKDGMPTSTTKVVHTRKRVTRHPKKILGVKVGHKTVTHKTVRETTTDGNGDTSTTVKRTN